MRSRAAAATSGGRSNSNRLAEPAGLASTTTLRSSTARFEPPLGVLGVGHQTQLAQQGPQLAGGEITGTVGDIGHHPARRSAGQVGGAVRQHPGATHIDPTRTQHLTDLGKPLGHVMSEGDLMLAAVRVNRNAAPTSRAANSPVRSSSPQRRVTSADIGCPFRLDRVKPAGPGPPSTAPRHDPQAGTGRSRQQGGELRSRRHRLQIHRQRRRRRAQSVVVHHHPPIMHRRCDKFAPNNRGLEVVSVRVSGPWLDRHDHRPHLESVSCLGLHSGFQVVGFRVTGYSNSCRSSAPWTVVAPLGEAPPGRCL